MLTERMQIQAITNLLANQETDLAVDNFSPKYKAVYEILQNTSPDRRQSTLEAMLQLNPQLEILVGQVINETPDTVTLDFSHEEIDTLCVNDPPLEFLWEDWIPRGEMSMILADPGLGKSIFSLDLCRRFLHDYPMPDGQKANRKRKNIIYIDAEDYRRGIYHRIRNWRQAEPSLWPTKHSGLHLMPYPKKDLLDFGQQRHKDALTERVASIRPDWVFLDSVTSAILKYTFDTEIAPIVAYFKGLMDDYDFALTLVHHHNKASSFRDINSIHNSAGAGLLARRSRVTMVLSCLSKGKQIDKKNDPRLISFPKANERTPDNLAFRFKPLHPSGVMLDYFDPEAEAMEQLAEKHQMVLDAISELEEKATPKNISDELDLSRGYVSTILRDLKEKGKIKKEKGYNSPYVVIDIDTH